MSEPISLASDVTEDDVLVPLCTRCLGRSHAATDPDFPHRLALPNERCGADDHDSDQTHTDNDDDRTDKVE